jgi:hypothetical protein
LLLPDLFAALDAGWTTFGVDEIDVEASEVGGHVDPAAPLHLRVNLHAHVHTGLDANLSAYQASVVHLAVSKGRHLELLERFPWKEPIDRRPPKGLPKDLHPLAHEMVSKGIVHPHAPSVIHCVGKWSKHLYFDGSRTVAEVVATIRKASALLPDMIGQRVDEAHEAKHREVDEGHGVPHEVVLSGAWRLLYRRPV